MEIASLAAEYTSSGRSAVHNAFGQVERSERGRKPARQDLVQRQVRRRAEATRAQAQPRRIQEDVRAFVDGAREERWRREYAVVLRRRADSHTQA